ncbi:Hypothetical predicted protein [Octopus vulgaris]|uniref:Uncharacterized protein n=1 Tax=Octopus vulgaris TaxID=6645 RepID=A0AA36FK79_OCTVU|nr:Hypothetical predicted protein [Octopus vulgaris]
MFTVEEKPVSLNGYHDDDYDNGGGRRRCRSGGHRGEVVVVVVIMLIVMVCDCDDILMKISQRKCENVTSIVVKESGDFVSRNPVIGLRRLDYEDQL